MKKVFIIAMMLLSTCIYAQDFNTELIMHYSFSGNAKESVNPLLDGIINNNAPLANDRFGINNKAYSFNGVNQSILIPYNNNYNFQTNDAFTISLWVSPNGLPAAGTANALVVRSPLTNNVFTSQWNYGVYLMPGGRIMGGRAPQAVDNGQVLLNSNTMLQTNGCWTHIVMTYDNGNWRLYINSINESNNLNNNRLILYNATDTNQIGFGQKGMTAGDYYNGRMDEVRIYRRALTQNDINALFNAETPNFSINNGVNSTICNGTTMNLVTSNNNYSYTWTGPNNQNIPCVGSCNSISVSPASLGNNVYTANTNIGGCNISSQSTIVVNNCCNENCYWTLNGNFPLATDNKYIGTNNNSDFVFKTGGSAAINERLRITASGNTGMGTTTPTEQLHTTAGVRFDGLTTPPSNISLNNMVGVDASGKLWRAPLMNGGGISNSCNAVNLIPRTTNLNGSLGCSQIFDNSASVGIDNTDPTYGNRILSKFTITQDDDDVDGVTFPTAFAIGTRTDPRLAINTHQDGSWSMFDYVNGSWHFGISHAGGQVGVQTTTPTANLHVLCQGDISNGVRFETLPVATTDPATYFNVLIDAAGNLYQDNRFAFKSTNTQVQSEIDDLKTELAELKSQVKALLEARNYSPCTVAQPSGTLEVVPTPFADNAKATYSIENFSGEASLQIADINGKVLKTFSINQAKGQIEIGAIQTSTSTVVFTIVSGGKVVVSKKSIKIAE